ALHNGVLAVSAINTSTTSSKVYVFRRTGVAQWVQEAHIPAITSGWSVNVPGIGDVTSTGVINSKFGASLSIHNNTLAIGQPNLTLVRATTNFTGFGSAYV
uniref:hypothetical protein n=1 Tax=Escherichia coli TaxID=562 RepID=UPI0013B3B02E